MWSPWNWSIDVTNPMITISKLTVNKQRIKLESIWSHYPIDSIIQDNIVIRFFYSLDNRCEFGRNKIGRTKIWKGKDDLVQFAMLAKKRMKIIWIEENCFWKIIWKYYSWAIVKKILKNCTVEAALG